MKFSQLNRATATAFLLSVCLTIAANAETVLDAIHAVQNELGARVGFYMHDTHTDDFIAYAENDHFPLNSTFKLFACGALLSHVETGTLRLADIVSLDDLSIVDYSPAIEDAVSAGRLEIPLEEACRMMLSLSDNTAANIVLSKIGGPKGLTEFMRSFGDKVTRLDRKEPELNTAAPGDLRDTTTARAAANSLQKLVLGDVLLPSSRARLREWLSAHSVADALFRAALPKTWSIDDRTGAGGFGSRSIIAVIYPPDREPIIVALYLTQTNASFRRRNAAIARIGRAIVGRIEQQ
ncbi:MAG: class A beta-lactamase [Aliishimia sp.]